MPRAALSKRVEQLARPTDFGIGKWSRIATYGTKRQRQPDGSSRTFEFNDVAFAQALANFQRMFAGRGKGMGSDYEHQALNAADNGQPAPNLCYFTAMGVIDQSERVAGLVDLRGDASALDPAAERARLTTQNPAADSDPAGVYVLCGEITPLGAELIPNYSQLSPAFDDNDVDEQEQPVGFAFWNVSFVNLAFQTGSSFNFAKGTPSMNDKELCDKLAKFGYSPDKPESLDDAYLGYLAATPEAPEERGKTVEAYRRMKKARMGDTQLDGPGSLPAGAPSASPPIVAAPGSMSENEKVMAGQLKAMSKRVEDAETRVSQAIEAEQARTKREHTERLVAFKKEMLESPNARYLPSQAADLDQLIADVGGDIEKARKHAERMPPIAAFQRFTAGGNPVGLASVPPPGIATMSRGQKGFAFNKAVRELRAKEPKLSFSEAQQRIAEEQPDLYDGSL